MGQSSIKETSPGCDILVCWSAGNHLIAVKIWRIYLDPKMFTNFSTKSTYFDQKALFFEEKVAKMKLLFEVELEPWNFDSHEIVICISSY